MNPSRRELCQAACVLAAGAALPACGGESVAAAPMCGSRAVAVGPASAVVTGTPNFVGATAQQSRNLYIGRDAQGVYAMDAECTHMGCLVRWTGQLYACPCHGSTFDGNGEHPTPPAPRALTHYAVCSDGAGNLLVDTSQPVDPKVRLEA